MSAPPDRRTDAARATDRRPRTPGRSRRSATPSAPRLDPAGPAVPTAHRGPGLVGPDRERPGQLAHGRGHRGRAQPRTPWARPSGTAQPRYAATPRWTPTRGLERLEGVLAAREAHAARATVEVVAFPQSGIIRDPGTADLLDAALSAGADLVGGIDPCGLDRDPAAHLDDGLRPGGTPPGRHRHPPARGSRARCVHPRPRLRTGPGTRHAGPGDHLPRLRPAHVHTRPHC